MLEAAKKATCDIQNVEFLFGFHSCPSMDGLHLHAISQDFCSPCLKTKRHYNSFTTPFFVEASLVLSTLKDGRPVLVDKAESESLLRLPLKCHVCGEKAKNMPALKRHLAAHQNSV